MTTKPDQHDYDESLEAAYIIESHGRYYMFYCRKCTHRYVFDKGDLTPGAVQHLHNHAADHGTIKHSP